MRVTKLALPAICIFLCAGEAAYAGVVSYTQALRISTGSLNPGEFILDLPDFNTKLGTLTQISLQFSGTVSDEVVFEDGSPEGGTFTAANNAEMAAGGFSPQDVYDLANGAFTFSAGSSRAYSTTQAVSFTASPAVAALGQYTTGLPPGFESAILNFGFTLLDANGNRVGGVSDGETMFTGQVVENYIYAATPVFEPATMAIAASGALALGLARRRRRM